jgi:hypothetical protein
LITFVISRKASREAIQAKAQLSQTSAVLYRRQSRLLNAEEQIVTKFKDWIAIREIPGLDMLPSGGSRTGNQDPSAYRWLAVNREKRIGH